MPTLRLTQSTVSPDRFRVEAALEGDGLPRRTATTEFDFIVTAQDREDLRWYLEDYLLHDADPAPMIAARIEGRIAALGVELFNALFQTNDDVRDLWATLRKTLNHTRIEIITEVQEATSLPWELLRDPKTDTPLSLRADAFVRASHEVAQRPSLPRNTAGPIRILLAICRPGGSSDVPFRSVASRLIKGLSESAREAYQLDVLRPATFEQLSKALRAAKAAGEAYHVVHFDGHGTYEEVSEPGGLASLRRAISSLVLSGARAGAHGYLLFENPAVGENLQLVDGPALGKLLAETDVPVLVLNACRSAHAESPAIPGTAPEGASSPAPAIVSGANLDVHGKVRAFGSLAQEVVDAGVAGVVAMRYNVYVVTAAQFVADMYESLARGRVLGEAVTLGRKQLEAQPLREIAYQPRPLQDWMVPIVYEAAPVKLFPKPAQDPQLRITISPDSAAPSFSGSLAPEVEKRPDVGFFGRDETILALDRAFDTQAIVLLHAYAGSGKTSTAAEFARWYHLTGGINGPVLFTSFEQYKPLAQVLNETIGRVFGDALEQSGVHWLTLTDEQRREVTLQVMTQIPVLWIWDNVEQIAGFPGLSQSTWNRAEQEVLAGFLRAAKHTKAKFLLTSRRDERGWLDDLPARISLPPMPIQERVEMARALAKKHGHRLAEVEVWMPLLRFTGGNPLTITVLVGQALRENLKTKSQIDAFVARVRMGESAFADEASEGRDKSLGSSLSYGFEHAFSEAERRLLALLYFFQGFVNVDSLKIMGDPKTPWSIPEVELTREAWITLLDRVAEVGLLTSHGGGYYAIHPALPWYFKNLFDQYYSLSPALGDERAMKATRAFVEVMGALGDFCAALYESGNREVLAAVTTEESNLLHARHLGRACSWWPPVIGTMQSLRVLYEQTGRRAEWARLVNEIVPDFVDPVTGGPLIGREENWGIVTSYRVRLAREARLWEEAEHLQRSCVNWDRQRASAALAVQPERLDRNERNAIRTLVVSLTELAAIQRELGLTECIALFEEAFSLSEQISDETTAAMVAFNLGVAFGGVKASARRDLTQAEHWYRRSLELLAEGDLLARARCVGQLGLVATERFKEARAAGQPERELLPHLNAALQLYTDALTLLPPNAVEDLSIASGQLANTYAEAGDIDRALPHWRDSIRYQEAAGNLYDAAQTRSNVAVGLKRAGRFADAMDYARAALQGFTVFGSTAKAELKRSQELIHQIQSEMTRGKGKP